MSCSGTLSPQTMVSRGRLTSAPPFPVPLSAATAPRRSDIAAHGCTLGREGAYCHHRLPLPAMPQLAQQHRKTLHLMVRSSPRPRVVTADFQESSIFVARSVTIVLSFDTCTFARLPFREALDRIVQDIVEAGHVKSTPCFNSQILPSSHSFHGYSLPSNPRPGHTLITFAIRSSPFSPIATSTTQTPHQSPLHHKHLGRTRLWRNQQVRQ